MEEIFIKNIKINNVRNIKDYLIPLSDDKKCNLIITGKNGSGKTSLLRELKRFLTQVTNGALEHYQNQLTELDQYKKRKKQLSANSNTTEAQIQQADNQIRSLENWFDQFGGTNIEFNQPLIIPNKFKSGDFIVAFFEAKRNTTLKVPTGINKINIKPVYQIDDHAGNEFIQYIVNLKADRSFAKDDNDIETVSKVDEWFVDFEKNLFRLFDNEEIKLQFDRKLYNFNIIENGKEPYNLNQLSDGYSAILSIVTELIMRMEEHKVKSYDVQGIVLVDEIETHLHIELQKRVLPFLTSFFPKIQFIVTTHSPFVLSSIKNTIICDLEKKIITTDLTGYSYDTLIESYFNSDKYSTELKIKIQDYESLKAKIDLSDIENDILKHLKSYFNDIPKFLSDELAVKLQQIKLKDLKK
jgi:predicted ATP-dependent endonuclease of OLD family